MSRILLYLLLLVSCHTYAQVPTAYAESRGTWFRIDTAGNRLAELKGYEEPEVTTPEYHDTVYSEGIYAVQRGEPASSTYRYYDADWNPIIDSAFDFAEPFYQGYGLVMSGDRLNAIDANGRFLLDVNIPNVHPGNTVQSLLADRILVIRRELDKTCNCELGGPQFGYKKRDGTWAIEPKFQSADMFSCGRALASFDGVHFGYIDSTGAWAIQPAYDGGRRFAAE